MDNEQHRFAGLNWELPLQKDEKEAPHTEKMFFEFWDNYL